MRVSFVTNLVEHDDVVFPYQLGRGAIYSAVFPAESAAVVGSHVGEEAGGVFVEVVGEVEAVGRCYCHWLCRCCRWSSGLRLSSRSTGWGRRGIAGGRSAIRRTDIDGYVYS